MKANVRPTFDPTSPATFELLDFSLFMYGLVRGDRVLVSQEGTPHYAELALYQLGDQWRLGIPYFETGSFWTRLSGLVTASKVEFSVHPRDRGRLVRHGHVTRVVLSALRGIGPAENSE